ncbi:hypothetical protein [Azorhizophilus paspali]|uniref:Uncharacterized protein n=1 Tax=Azorhizophilus paspali TaxID=69963 RepID=A0ABV6SNW3_AZOPA
MNRGLELSANGEILPSLSIYGGATWLDPRLRDTAREDTSDKRIVSVPTIQANFQDNVARVRRALEGVPAEKRRRLYHCMGDPLSTSGRSSLN